METRRMYRLHCARHASVLNFYLVISSQKVLKVIYIKCLKLSKPIERDNSRTRLRSTSLDGLRLKSLLHTPSTQNIIDNSK